MGFVSVSLLVAIISAALYLYLLSIPRAQIPSHLLNHHAEWIPDFIPQEDFDALNGIIREMKDFPSNLDADTKTGGFTVRHEHIGEAEIINSDGTCSHPYLVPNLNRTLCILPQRVDVGRHFITYGGPNAIREPFDKMISRVSSFGRYMFQTVDRYPTMTKLFAQDNFQAAAKRVCPKDQQFLDPFQFNFIVQVPGQTVATHVDGVYFWGATRKEFPQWLLACMAFSQSFFPQFIHQVQVVGYLHSWSPVESTEGGSVSTTTGARRLKSSVGGEFIFYNSNDPLPEAVLPYPRSGSLVDGSKTVHAANVYLPEVAAPVLNKNKANVLSYLGEEHWGLFIDGKLAHNYTTTDLRTCIVYRARCFRDAEERDRFYHLPEEEVMSLDHVLDTLVAEMVQGSSGRYLPPPCPSTHTTPTDTRERAS
jgi:hypothetical protein